MNTITMKRIRSAGSQDNEYQVLGSAKLDDLNEKLDLHLDSEVNDSIGGLYH